ncbi:TPA: fimbrial protein [Pseudomonas aeruginosa]
MAYRRAAVSRALSRKSRRSSCSATRRRSPTASSRAERSTRTSSLPTRTGLSIRLTGSVTTINATCQVADQTVKLQSIAAARLNGVGTYAAVTPFNLVVAGCPRGYNRVGYSLQAVGGAVAEGSGVLPRLAGSTATGVSIRVTDEAGVPLRMGLSLPVSAYDKNTGGAYWIPMKASYVQTAEKITPGSVLAAMVILLDYQ